MADETEAPKELTPREKFVKAVEDYNKALQSGDRKLAAQIHKDNNLPFSEGNHS